MSRPTNRQLALWPMYQQQQDQILLLQLESYTSICQDQVTITGLTWSVLWDTSKELWSMVWIFLVMKRHQNCLATVMQIGQGMLTLDREDQAMCFRLEVTQSVGQAGNKQQLRSSIRCFELSYTESCMATPFSGRSRKTDGCTDYHLRR